MGDAAPRRHPVDLAGADELLDAEAVAMGELSVEEIADGRQPDMRMGLHIGGAKSLRRQTQGPAMVEEDERADHAALAERQDAAHREAAAEIGLARVDDELGHGKASVLRSEEHTSELQSLMRISYAVFCLKKKQQPKHTVVLL